jgi:hypothetical protein
MPAMIKPSFVAPHAFRVFMCLLLEFKQLAGFYLYNVLRAARLTRKLPNCGLLPNWLAGL